jgi:hypothetical protein
MENLPEQQRTPLEISSLSKLQKEYPAIRSLKNDVPIEQALAYCCVLIGLNKDRYPVKLEKKVLVDFVKEKYPSYVAPEIVNAFKMAMNREFGELDVNHYQNFSVEYFARIMTAYNEDRKNKLQQIQNKKVTHIESPISDVEYFENVLLKPYELYCETGVYPFKYINEFLLYDSLWRIGLSICESDEEREAFKFEARKLVPRKKRTSAFGKDQSDADYELDVKHKAKSMAFKRWIEEHSFNETNLREIITILIRK